MRKQRRVEETIVQNNQKWTIKSSANKPISCAEAAIQMYDILFPKRSTEEIGLSLGIPVNYNW